MNAFIKRWRGLVFQVAAVIAVVGFILLSLRRTVPLPDLVGVGPVVVRMYSVVMVAALITAILYARWLLKQNAKLSKIDVWEVFLYVLVPGIIGARFYHVLTEWYLYIDQPVRTVALWTGGLNIFGGLAGGAIGLWWFCRRHRVDYRQLLGLAALVLPVAQIIGRLGNYFNRELYGLPTDLPWGMYIEPAYRYTIFRAAEYYHPLFLYEMLINLLLWFLLLKLWKLEWKPLQLAKVYVIGYMLTRYILDFGRIEYKPVGGLSYTQLVILGTFTAVVVGGAVYQLWHRRRFGIWFTKHQL